MRPQSRPNKHTVLDLQQPQLRLVILVMANLRTIGKGRAVVRATSILVILWGPLINPWKVQAQALTGTIQGTVVDSTGSVIVGARVMIRQPAAGVTRTTETDDNGEFRFSGLPIGEYSLRCEQTGFATIVTEPFQVSVAQTVTRRMEMKLGEISENLEVKERPAALDATATTTSVALGGERIEEGPASNRNYLNFVLMAPGVAQSNGSSTQRSLVGIRNVNNDSGFSFGGLRGRNNSLLIDGVDNRDETTGGNRVAIGLEMVQEFRVSGTTVGAEFGGAAGGLVNMVTRSGTNLWHGDATFFTQHERFNARNPEALTQDRPRFRRYQPGVSVNGPIRKDGTFFSTALEQEWESSEEWSDAPADAVTAINEALRRPEFSGASVRSVERGLFPARSSETEFSFKANHQVGSVHSLSARYAFSRGRLSGDVQGVDNFADRSSRGSSLTRDHSMVAGWIYVPSSRDVSDLRVQVARRTVTMTPNAGGAMLEIPGVLTLGQAFRLDSSRTEDHYEVVEALTLSRRRHQISVGGSLHAVSLRSRLANRYGGIFLFPSLDDFLLGQPDVFIQALGDPTTRLATFPAATWIHDRWQLRPDLSVEAGLRYDRQTMPQGFSVSARNVAPRLGVAWQPQGQPLVLRAGFGFFFDRYPLAFLNEGIQKDGRQGYELYTTGASAARVFSLTRGAKLPGPLVGLQPSAYAADPDFPATHSRKLTAGLERGFGPDTTLAIEVASVRAFHLPRIRNRAATPVPTYQLEQTARSSFVGGSVTLNRRLSRGLTFLVAYNLGRTHDDASDYDEHPLDPFDLRHDWARSRQHQAHRFAASALFDLPVEAVRSLPKWLGESLDDISLAPILTVGSRRPLNALASTDTFRTGAYPLSARPFGLPRNPFWSPALVNIDLRLMKTLFLWRERARLQFGVEVFNLSNHSNPLRVSPYYASRDHRMDSYGQALETLNARQMQWLVQLEY
jgi:hypothetical protein